MAKELVWIDLEMTGLNPQIHKIIEIATIITLIKRINKVLLIKFLYLFKFFSCKRFVIFFVILSDIGIDISIIAMEIIYFKFVNIYIHK